ncbi:hypothetical protein CF327_g5105 [Tilletia walkeri]|uniref:Acyl-CoA thioesterase II n=1 Tax=Tilletia walkeri TaxID=117179 RepID=A0A8X7T4M4_9BASI|nr:hypothetical protein CF327_g5105 [Tilletia walkeri]KAE8268722.1 hypothetical protein A4X09_0g3613 [Tilletia walkeri]
MTEEFDPSEPPTSFYEFIALRRVDAAQGSSTARELRYSTIYPPRAFGSAIAFGGSSLAPVAQAAYCALQEIAGDAASASAYSAYSFQGCFAGPARLDRLLDIHVKTIRWTRTFVTFLITVSQTDRKGNTKKTMVATFDFIRQGPALLEFGPVPKDPVTGLPWSPPDNLRSYYDEAAQRAEEGVRSPRALAIEGLAITGWEEILEIRMPPESLSAQTMGCLISSLPTTQDKLRPTEKRASDWQRYTTPFNTDAIAKDAFAQSGTGITPASANIAAMCHVSDTRLAWMAPCTAVIPIKLLEFTATLDFSIRFHRSAKDLHADEWFLREMRSVTAAEGRSFGESRFWDRQGRLIVTMSQQCLLRPHRADDIKAIKLKL